MAGRRQNFRLKSVFVTALPVNCLNQPSRSLNRLANPKHGLSRLSKSEDSVHYVSCLLVCHLSVLTGHLSQITGRLARGRKQNVSLSWRSYVASRLQVVGPVDSAAFFRFASIFFSEVIGSPVS